MDLQALETSNLQFTSARIALLTQNSILVYERDSIPQIPYPGFIDLPGGGREGAETPFACIQRETTEEFGITICKDDINWLTLHPSSNQKNSFSVFYYGTITPEMISAIRFGNEGHSWQMMPIRNFLHHPKAVPAFKKRLNDYLRSDRSKP